MAQMCTYLYLWRKVHSETVILHLPTYRGRKEIEKIAKQGVPGVWGLSPPKPDLE